MGIKGLTTFLDDHRFLTETCSLQDTKLVIDGYSLLYHLYLNAELDMKHGGENLVFYGVCQTFVANLRKCEIEPFILMDGAIDPDGKKFSTMKDRHKDRVRMALSLAAGGHGVVLPVFAIDVFRQALTDSGVNYAQCDFEADSEISALANAYQCPVLSNDSDFYVTDLTGGFINLKGFNFHKLQHTKKSKSSFLTCKIFHVDRFCKHFKLKKSLLPLFGTLQGNDYVDHFVGMKLKELIHWLAAFDSPDDAIEASLKHEYHQHRDKLRNKIQTSIEMYTVNSTSEYATYFETKEINQEECLLWQNYDLPLWFITEFRSWSLPSDSLNAQLMKKCFLENFIESPHHASSNKISLPIRQMIYGFIHQSDCSENPTIDEYDRQGGEVKCRQVSPKYCAFSIHNIRELDKTQSKQLFMDCLMLKSEDLHNIKREFQVPIASMLYWIKHAKPNVSWRHILALLLGLLKSSGIKQLHDQQFKQGYVEDSCNWIQNRFRETRVTFIEREGNFDVNVGNIFAQWQSVLKYISHLNAFLSNPFSTFDVSVLYNGSFLHQIYNCFKTFQKPEKAIEFVDNSNALGNEFHVLSFMYSTVMEHSKSPKSANKGSTDSKEETKGASRQKGGKVEELKKVAGGGKKETSGNRQTDGGIKKPESAQKKHENIASQTNRRERNKNGERGSWGGGRTSQSNEKGDTVGGARGGSSAKGGEKDASRCGGRGVSGGSGRGANGGGGRGAKGSGGSSAKDSERDASRGANGGGGRGAKGSGGSSAKDGERDASRGGGRGANGGGGRGAKVSEKDASRGGRRGAKGGGRGAKGGGGRGASRGGGKESNRGNGRGASGTSTGRSEFEDNLTEMYLYLNQIVQGQK